VLKFDHYERSDERAAYRNGYKDKTVSTRLGKITVQVPQVRGGVSFYPSSLEKGIRSERALKLAIAEMYVKGVATRKVSAIVEELCGTEVSSTQVSDAAKELDEEISAWRNRPLGRYQYLMLDARYEHVRQGNAVVSSAVLIAVGITYEGRRELLGVSVSLSEAEVHWRQSCL
jgi:transposase-like protein